jgi:hypothetical protein
MPPTASAARFNWGERWVIKTMDRQIFAFVLMVIGDNHTAKNQFQYERSFLLAGLLTA